MIAEAFRLLPSNFLSFGIKWNDACLIYLFVTSIFEYSKNRNVFSTKNDEIGRVIKLILCYFTILLFCTWLFIEQDPFSAVKVYRVYLLYGIYFQFRTLDFNQRSQIFRFIFAFIILTAILFIQQAATGVSILVGGSDEVISLNEFQRFRNTSRFIEFGLFALIFTDKVKKHKALYMCILAVALLLPMSRTVVIVFAGTSFCYAMLVFKNKYKLVKYAFPIGLGLLIAWPYFSQRLEDENTAADISKALSMKSASDFNQNSDGTLAFRIAIFIERLDYLIDNNKLLFGSGLVHEDSKYTQQEFKFMLGATRVQDGERVIQQITTNDTSWTTMMIISGLIGICLHLWLFLLMARKLNAFSKQDTLFIPPLLTLILCLCTSISDYRLASQYYIALFMLFASTSLINKTKCENII